MISGGTVHWRLMTVDVSQRKAYFDDGLGWSFPPITYLHVIVKQPHSMFPECDNFSLNHWRREALKDLECQDNPPTVEILEAEAVALGSYFRLKILWWAFHLRGLLVRWLFIGRKLWKSYGRKLWNSYLRDWMFISKWQVLVRNMWVYADPEICVFFSWVIAAYTILHKRHGVLTAAVFTRIISRVLQHTMSLDSEKWRSVDNLCFMQFKSSLTFVCV